jgi:hypothetical protein
MIVLVIFGVILLFIGGIGILIAAFKTSFLWGLGCLLIAPMSLVFLIMHWEDAKNPFFLQIIGIMLVCIGSSYADANSARAAVAPAASHVVSSVAPFS